MVGISNKSVPEMVTDSFPAACVAQPIFVDPQSLVRPELRQLAARAIVPWAGLEAQPMGEKSEWDNVYVLYIIIIYSIIFNVYHI